MLVDTNVLVSAFITRGLSADVFRLILSEHTLLTNTEILVELERTLKTKINVPGAQVTSILTFLESFETIDNLTPPVDIQIRDKSDIHVLAAALNGQADLIVSGDKDLLEISEDYGIRIVDPRTFIELTRKKDQ